MPKTLLAVDDSATMRKVLEITFSGEDFKVITANSGATALSMMSEEPSVVLLDASLGSEDAYALSKEIRGRDPKCVIVILSSRYSPYDANKGRDAGADDFMDKPFDTQQMIDKVKKALLTRSSEPAAAQAKPAAAAAPPAPSVTATTPSIISPFAQPKAPAAAPTPQPAAAAPVVPAAPAAKPGFQGSRSHTLSFEGTPQPKPVAPAMPAAPAAVAAPASKTAVTSSGSIAHASPAAASVGSSVNGHLAGKLGELGLSQTQADAVLALSREVVERVVWEVVPQLAEAMLKEEIARLLKDG